MTTESPLQALQMGALSDLRVAQDRFTQLLYFVEQHEDIDSSLFDTCAIDVITALHKVGLSIRTLGWTADTLAAAVTRPDAAVNVKPESRDSGGDDPAPLPEPDRTGHKPKLVPAQSVPCPSCGAAKGDPCFKMDRRGVGAKPTTERAPSGYSHQSRRDFASGRRK